MKYAWFLLLAMLSTAGKLTAQCNAAFTYTASYDSAVFAASQQQPHLQHHWYLGDGHTAAGAFTAHVYNAPGQYNVTHVVIDTINGCVDSANQVINIVFTPTCAVSASYSKSPAHPNKYTFSAVPAPAGTVVQGYTWTIDGNIISNNVSFTYKFGQTGTYRISVKMQTTAGCTAYDSLHVTVGSLDSCSIQPSFTSSATSNPLQIQFKAQPNNSAYQYYWMFGDGTTSSNKNPLHTYANSGTYKVYLYVIKHAGTDSCIGYTTRQITVGDTIPHDTCSTWFTAVHNAANNKQVSFTAHGSKPVTAQRWTFYRPQSNDSIVISQQNAVYTFPDTGYYEVCLRAVMDSSCVANYCSTIRIKADTIPRDSCSTSFTAVANAANNRQVSFTAHGSGLVTAQQWFIYGSITSDSVTLSQYNPVYTFSDTGYYQVCLKATIDSSCVAYYCSTIHIKADTVPQDSCNTWFTAVHNVSNNKQVHFTAHGSGLVTAQHWFIYGSSTSDSVTLSQHNPVYTFSDTGYYQVCLKATMDSNCVAYYCKKILITADSMSASLIYPNPVTTTATLKVELPATAPVQLVVYNAYGFAVATKKVGGQKGINNLSVPVDNLRPGLYFVEMQYGKYKNRIRFQKL